MSVGVVTTVCFFPIGATPPPDEKERWVEFGFIPDQPQFTDALYATVPRPNPTKTVREFIPAEVVEANRQDGDDRLFGGWFHSDFGLIRGD